MKYVIKKGKHSSGFHFGFTFKNKISFDVVFTKSCLYSPFPHPDTKDINKLCGFATTLSHHKQSARVGWRCVDKSGMIELVTYSYDSSKRDIKDQNVIGKVKPDKIFTVSIEDFEDHYLYTFEQRGKKITNKDHKKPDWWPIKYILKPYFGGNQSAPHEMKIFVNKR